MLTTWESLHARPNSHLPHGLDFPAGPDAAFCRCAAHMPDLIRISPNETETFSNGKRQCDWETEVDGQGIIK